MLVQRVSYLSFVQPHSKTCWLFIKVLLMLGSALCHCNAEHLFHMFVSHLPARVGAHGGESMIQHVVHLPGMPRNQPALLFLTQLPPLPVLLSHVMPQIIHLKRGVPDVQAAPLADVIKSNDSIAVQVQKVEQAVLEHHGVAQVQVLAGGGGWGAAKGAIWFGSLGEDGIQGQHLHPQRVLPNAFVGARQPVILALPPA